MVIGLLWILGCQLAGQLLVDHTGLPVPGPVAGMVLLFGVLLWRDDARIVATGSTLLEHLQLFFVPAGVGVIAYATVLRDNALVLIVAVGVSWLVGLAVAGWLTERLDHGGEA